MSIDVIDLVDLAHQEKRRKNIFNTLRFHAWMHYYKPGQKDEMHCHNADQTFYVIEGECTMRFPDGGQVVLKSGAGGADHGRIVLPAGERRLRADDHDG
jgi:quercetin dioxygenase-like cupin family protein